MRWLAAVCALALACTSKPPPPSIQRLAAARADAGVEAPAARPTPPVAARIPHDVVGPFGTRSDPYYWLRDDTRSQKPVLDYLHAEDTYAAAMLAPAKAIEDKVVAETRGRIADDETTAPELEDGYWYYARYVAGQQHPVYVRRKGTMSAPEEILLDGNALAAGHPFYEIGSYAVSPDTKLLAWTDDIVGRNQFTLHIKRLDTGAQLTDTATAIGESVVWANDNTTVFYVGKDTTTLREDRVMRHAVGGTHEVVYREPDGAFYADVGRTKSRSYVLLSLEATDQSETRLVDANKPTSAPEVFIPRRDDVLYEIDHVGDRFIMRTNALGGNFALVEVPATGRTNAKRWKPLLPHRADALIEGFAAYETFVAAEVRVAGLRRVQLVDKKHSAKKPYYIESSEPAFTMNLIDTDDSRSTRVRYALDTLAAPSTTYEQDVATGTRTVVHQEPAPTYDPAQYTTAYLHAKASDGERVPISVVYRKDTKLDGTAPLLITGYGAYAESVDPAYDATRVSLLDRGWVFAIAHVRGGDELGDAWYDAGREQNKMNTFTDFIAATEHLVTAKYAAKDRVFAEGGSAGGLLVAAIANLRPELYKGLVAWVPFVDIVTTMLDPTIPLVTNEYEEWGDPRDKTAHDYMLAYSPYDNVTAQAYPALYVRTGLYDSQVQYYEPAKWVAKLRATKTDNHLLLFETDWTAGHAGKSGRYDAIREQARAYAFMLYVLDGAVAQ